MDTFAVAQDFTRLCAAGKFDEAGATHWSDAIVSLEPYPGELATLKGRSEVLKKVAFWSENNQIHGCRVEGPFVHGNQFAVRFALDVTPKGGPRTTMHEVGLYTVEDGKIVEERFFFGQP